MPSVSTPMPIAVKKLMLKRVFFGSSVGKMPTKAGWSSSALKRSASCFIPTPCARSSIKILMKIREDDVVSSSLRWMLCNTCHPIASLASRWPMNCATMRRRFVS